MKRDQRWWISALGVVIGGVVGWLLVSRTISVIHVVSFLTCFILVVPVHEVGHALAGALVGHHIMSLSIGVGRQLAAFKLGSMTVHLRVMPLGGMTTGCPGRSRRFPRLREWIFASGGLLAQLGLGLLMRRLFGAALDDYKNHPILATAASANWTMMLLNAIPFRMAEGTASDGLHLLTIPTLSRERIDRLHIMAETHQMMEAIRRGDVARGVALGEAIHRRYPGHPNALLGYGTALERARRHGEALAFWWQGLAVANEPQLIAILKNNIAWAHAVLNRADDLPEAERLSAEALAVLPDMAAVLGTRGTVLVRLGRGAEALPLLQRGFAEATEAHGRAMARAFIANALWLCGRVDEARRALDEARAIDPGCEALAGIEATLASAPPATPEGPLAGRTQPFDMAAAPTQAAAGARLLAAWRRDARIVSALAALILPQRLGVPFLNGIILAVFITIAPHPGSVLAFGLACAWVTVVLASGQLHFGFSYGLDADPVPAGAALIALAFAAAYLWLFQRSRRFGPPTSTRGIVALGIVLGILLVPEALANLARAMVGGSALNLHEIFRGMSQSGFSLMALGGLGLLSRRRWVRAASALPLALALVSSVGASDWSFEHYAAGGIPRNGAAISWSAPQPATLLRRRKFSMPGGRAILSPGGGAFALFDRGDEENPRTIVHVGDFGSRSADVDGLGAVFIDDERLLVVRRQGDDGSAQLVEIHPFASREPVWTRDVPDLQPYFSTLVYDRRSQRVVLRGSKALIQEGSDRVTHEISWLETRAERDAAWRSILIPAKVVPGGLRDKSISAFIGPVGPVELALRGPDARPSGGTRWRRHRVESALWLFGPRESTLLSPDMPNLECAQPGLGQSTIWCLSPGIMARPMLLRVDAARAVVERVPGRVPGASEMTMIDDSHLALFFYGAELQVIDTDTRRGVRLTLPASESDEISILLDGSLAIFERAPQGSGGTISVYAVPAEQ